MTKISLSSPLAAMLAITSANATYFSLIAGFITEEVSFAILNVILMTYLSYEIFRLARAGYPRLFSNQALICSFMTFMLYYGITNILYFLPEKYTMLVNLKPVITVYMNKLMLAAIIGATGMWLGYWSKTSVVLINSRYLRNIKAKYFTQNAELYDEALILLVAVGVFSRLMQIALGVYGYASSYDQYINAAAYTQYLNLGGYCGKIALLAIALQFYSGHSSLKTKFWFFLILILEVFFGLISGFKKMVTLPFFMIMICQYMLKGRISKIWILGAILGLLLAYSIIEPFRALRNEQGDKFDSTSITYIVASFFESPKDVDAAYEDEEPDSDAPTILKVMSRTNIVAIGSLGIKFADETVELPPDTPEFLSDIILSPVFSWVPRFLWSGKTLQNIGLWYTQTVMGAKYLYSSTAMGMVTYLYFAGGFLGVFIGFAFVGCMQRVITYTTQPWKTGAGTLVFLSTMTTVAIIAELNMDALLVLLFRFLPIVMVIQAIVYKHPYKRK